MIPPKIVAIAALLQKYKSQVHLYTLSHNCNQFQGYTSYGWSTHLKQKGTTIEASVLVPLTAQTANRCWLGGQMAVSSLTAQLLGQL